MSTNLEGLSRQKAAEFLSQLRQSRAAGRLLDVQLVGSSDWVHPRTAELMDRAEILENALESLLTARAGGRS